MKLNDSQKVSNPTVRNNPKNRSQAGCGLERVESGIRIHTRRGRAEAPGAASATRTPGSQPASRGEKLRRSAALVEFPPARSRALHPPHPGDGPCVREGYSLRGAARWFPRTAEDAVAAPRRRPGSRSPRRRCRPWSGCERALEATPLGGQTPRTALNRQNPPQPPFWAVGKTGEGAELPPGQGAEVVGRHRSVGR